MSGNHSLKSLTCSSVHSVGNSLGTAIRESHTVLALGEVTITVLGGSEVIVSVVILHGVVVVVDSGLVSVLVHIGLVGNSGGGLVGHGSNLTKIVSELRGFVIRGPGHRDGGCDATNV